MTNKVIKVLSVVTTLVGVAVTLLSDYVQSKKLDNTITEKIAEALANKEN